MLKLQPLYCVLEIFSSELQVMTLSKMDLCFRSLWFLFSRVFQPLMCFIRIRCRISFLQVSVESFGIQLSKCCFTQCDAYWLRLRAEVSHDLYDGLYDVLENFMSFGFSVFKSLFLRILLVSVSVENFRS